MIRNRLKMRNKRSFVKGKDAIKRKGKFENEAL